MRSGFGSNDQLERRVTDLERQRRLTETGAGRIAAMGTFSLTADGSATSTNVTDSSVVGTSLIMFVPANADAWSLDGALNGITPGGGSFSVSHQASTLARSYNYVVINPV